MFRYKIIQLQWETNIWSDMTSYWSNGYDSELEESSNLLIDCDIQQIVKISLYSNLFSYWEISSDNSKSIMINDTPLNLFVKVRY